jgi:hypothetical protein
MVLIYINVALYNKHFKKWEIGKNTPRDMIRKQRERALENKKPAFRVRKLPVGSERINRYTTKNGIPPVSANDDMNLDESMSPAGMSPHAERFIWIRT